jgi:DtxR family Mn-dependent transcriptional regulator
MKFYSEENYLKIIYHLSETGQTVSTNAIAEKAGTKAASVTDMLKKLAEKNLVNYIKYQGVSLSTAGKQAALDIVRKHRLWEVFLTDKLHFKWDEVHEIAEELEHINNPILVERLDEFLGYPKIDPHGDPIPDNRGNFHHNELISLAKLSVGDKGVVSGVNEHSPAFLQHLDKLGLTLGKNIEVLDKIEYDGSFELSVENKSIMLSKDVAKQLLILKK